MTSPSTRCWLTRAGQQAVRRGVIALERNGIDQQIRDLLPSIGQVAQAARATRVRTANLGSGRQRVRQRGRAHRRTRARPRHDRDADARAPGWAPGRTTTSSAAEAARCPCRLSNSTSTWSPRMCQMLAWIRGCTCGSTIRVTDSETAVTAYHSAAMGRPLMDPPDATGTRILHGRKHRTAPWLGRRVRVSMSDDAEAPDPDAGTDAAWAHTSHGMGGRAARPAEQVRRAVRASASTTILERHRHHLLVDLGLRLYERDRESAGTLVGSALAFRLFLFFAPLGVVRRRAGRLHRTGGRRGRRQLRRSDRYPRRSDRDCAGSAERDALGRDRRRRIRYGGGRSDPEPGDGGGQLPVVASAGADQGVPSTDRCLGRAVVRDGADLDSGQPDPSRAGHRRRRGLVRRRVLLLRRRVGTALAAAAETHPRSRGAAAWRCASSRSCCPACKPSASSCCRISSIGPRSCTARSARPW